MYKHDRPYFMLCLTSWIYYWIGLQFEQNFGRSITDSCIGPCLQWADTLSGQVLNFDPADLGMNRNSGTLI